MTAAREYDIWKFMAMVVASERPRSYWFNVGNIHCYFRAGATYFPAGGIGLHAGVAIASVHLDPEHQGKGEFRKFLADVEDEAKRVGYRSIRVECIHNPIILDMLARRGWQIHPDEPPTYYKVLQ